MSHTQATARATTDNEGLGIFFNLNLKSGNNIEIAAIWGW